MDEIDERLGEMQMVLNAMYRRIAEMEQRIRHLEQGQSMCGTVEGLEGEWTVSPPPGFTREP